MCKKIIERHGGTIEARSSPGQGATFLIRLPIEAKIRGNS
ncbi:MAG TPA: ATP-binding protein [Polyangia bacterium]|nr:ATP-binding protein [Polyangia bacterium]